MRKTNLVKWEQFKSRLRYLVYGEYFTDALRNTLAIVLPVIFLFYHQQEQVAIGIGLGALLISLTDLPGNRGDKFKSAITSVAIFFLTALIVSWCLGDLWLTASAIFLLTFGLSMLALFGTRMGLTGMMAIVLCTFVIGLQPKEPFEFSFYLFIGGTWYYLISLIQIMIWPYRSLHHAIFECLESTAVLLRSKTNSYNPEVPLEDCYRETISLHIKVSEKQELMRNFLLSDPAAMKPTNQKGRRLLNVALNVIDLYEQVTAIHYDYAFVRGTLSEGGALKKVISLIEILADELQFLSGTFLTPGKKAFESRRLIEFERGKDELLKLAEGEGAVGAGILFKVIKNMEDIGAHILDISANQLSNSNVNVNAMESNHYKDFLSSSVFSLNSFKQHFSFRSPIFRFALRLAVLCFFTYLLTQLLPFEKYSYWMLLTIVVVVRPRFGLTRKRNIERLLGTLLGVLVGLLLLIVFNQTYILLTLSSFFLLGFFTFNRTKYAVSVSCITAMVILCLSIYNGHTGYIILERIYCTLIGCAIAYSAAYLFPVWEISQLQNLIHNVVKANMDYLKAVTLELWGNAGTAKASKLARKNAYLMLAKFSEARQYMLMEPHFKRTDASGVDAIEYLSYQMNALIASLSLAEKQIEAPAAVVGYEQVLSNLGYCLKTAEFGIENIQNVSEPLEKTTNGGDHDQTLDHQLRLLNELSKELRKYFTPKAKN